MPYGSRIAAAYSPPWRTWSPAVGNGLVISCSLSGRSRLSTVTASHAHCEVRCASPQVPTRTRPCRPLKLRRLLALGERVAAQHWCRRDGHSFNLSSSYSHRQFAYLALGPRHVYHVEGQQPVACDAQALRTKKGESGTTGFSHSLRHCEVPATSDGIKNYEHFWDVPRMGQGCCRRIVGYGPPWRPPHPSHARTPCTVL